VSLKDRIAAGQASRTDTVSPVGRRTTPSFPKRRYGSVEYELWQIGQPLMDAAFGIIRGPEDLATLINLCETAESSKESRRNIDKFLKDRAKKAVTDLKRWLGLRRGRRPDIYKQRVWAIGAALRRENHGRCSWARITQKLDPRGYSENAQQATDRMRMGIQALEERQAKKQAAP
jgi:hypothetical protein